MKWSASIALISSMLAAVATVHGAATDLQQGKDAASQVGTAMHSYTGTGQALSSNLVTPLVQASQITTADGKTKFVTNGFQSSGKPLIQITINPDPATGDVKNIILQQDLGGAGVFNYLQTFPISGDAPGQEISAVCQNGYVQCNPSFTNCRYRSWVSTSNGQVTAQTSGGQAGTAGSVGNLASCFCFNNFCTGQNNTLIELGNIASDIGGGILSAFLQANTGIAISSATSGANAAGAIVLTYYGYKPVTVSNGNNTASMTPSEIADMPVLPPADTQTPQAFYQDSAALNNSAQNVLAAQKAAPNSLYNIATNAALSQTGTTVTCTNSVQPALASDTQTVSQSGSTVLSVDDSISWAFTETALNTFVFSSVENKGHGEPDITYTFQPSTTLGGYALQSVSFAGNIAGNGSTIWGYSVNPMWTPGVGIGVPITGNSGKFCPGNGYQAPVMNWTFTAQYVTQKETDVTNSGCSQFESDSKCTLQQDVWDGRPVVVNGMKMNNQQLGQACKTLPGVGTLLPVTVCKPWFVQNRSYYCKNTASAYDFSTVKANAATIENSISTPSSSSMRYTDPTQGGAIMTYGTPTAAPLGACSQVCETKIPVGRTGVLYTDTPQSANQVAATQTAAQFIFYYKDCTTDVSGNPNCPLDSSKGEVVVTQCGCSADMGRAIGALNAAGSAAQDAICSAP